MALIQEVQRMKKVLVLKSLTKEEEKEYLSISGLEFSFMKPEEVKEEDVNSASMIIGDVTSDILKMMVEKETGEDEASYGEDPGFAKIFNKPIILASASPRRSELLTKADIPFIVMPANIDESIKTEDPAFAAEEISARKAEAVSRRLLNEGKEDPFVVLSADTVVSIDGKILGKPKDNEDAFNMLHELQGRDHDVFTGVTIGIKREGDHIHYKHFNERTRVKIYPISDEQIRDYISTGEPLDKAGSYAIQGSFAKYIKSIQGDYSNVVGLPVGRVFKELRQFLRK